jgi:hypothetical protein
MWGTVDQFFYTLRFEIDKIILGGLNMKKRFLAFLLTFAMIFSMMPLTAFAADESVNVDFSAQMANGFLCAPQNDTEVSASLAEDYGYTDEVKDGVSALDVLVKAHQVIFEDAFTPETAADYLVADDGFITTVFGVETSNFGFAVNGATPHDDVLVSDPSYGEYYTGYSINQAVINSGDSVEFYITQDSYYFDNYVWFEQDGQKLEEVTLNVGEESQFTLMGYPIVWYGCSKDEDIQENTDVVSDAQLCLVDANTGAITDLENVITDEDGQATVSFDEAGEYLLSAYITEEDIANYGTPIIMPLLDVNVLTDASFTVPADAELFVGEKDKHYVPFTEKTATTVVNNGDNTKTYYFDLTNNKTYNFRVSGEDYVTNAGTFRKTANYSKVITVADLQPEGKTKNTVDHDVTSNNGYNVADIYLNINPQGYLKMSGVDDTYQIVNLRNWEIVDSTVNNYFIEPDYHYYVIDENGQASDDVVTIDENGLITAKGNGTAIVLVTYDAINVSPAAGGSFFGAIWPENTGVFVVSVGAEDSGIDTGMTINEGKNTNAETGKQALDAIDAEMDVIYFVGEKGEYSFTPGTEGCSVAVANPQVADTMSFNGFKAVNANADGSYTVPLTEGRNIVKITKGDKYEYQVITAKEISYTVNNGDPVKPGDTINIVFDTLYHPANKLASVYNMSAIVVYDNVSGYEGQMAGSTSSQYSFASSANAQTVNNIITRSVDNWGTASYKKQADLTVPEDYSSDTFTLSGGQLIAVGYGDPYGNHRGITLTDGKAPSFNASAKEGFFAQLPDIEIPITITESALESISLTTDGVKTDYYAGDTFDTTNLVVTAKYEDGKTQTTENYTVSPSVLTEDTKEVVITYKDKTATIPVEVTPLEVKSIEVTTPPTKTEYEEGDVFDPTGMVITATYNNGTTAVTNDYEYSPQRELKTSDTEMTITYVGENVADAVAPVTTPITVNKASGGSTGSKVTVSFTLLGDKKHDSSSDGEVHTLKDGNLETWIAKTDITVDKGSYVIDVVTKALSMNGIPYTNPTGGYIDSIKGLAEFSNGPDSGWMYTLNGKHVQVAVNEQVVKNGDEIVLHYTDNHNLEDSFNGNGGGGGTVVDPVDNVITLIKNIGTVTKDSGAKIEAARTAYDKLTAAEKAKVTNYQTLLDAEAAYEKITQGTDSGFVDVKDHWAANAINFVVKENLFKGTSDTTFEPNATMTRAMMVTVLWRLAGQPEVTTFADFADVADDAYYAKAVSWANEAGIVKGYDNNLFGSNDNVTREDMASFMYRYAKYKGYDLSKTADLSGYTDMDQISAYALENMKWANANGLIQGRTETTLAPKGDSTRAEVAAIFQRFVENIVKDNK